MQRSRRVPTHRRGLDSIVSNKQAIIVLYFVGNKQTQQVMTNMIAAMKNVTQTPTQNITDLYFNSSLVG